MKYIITGASGNISRPLAEALLSKGHEVIVIGRNAEHLSHLQSKGAQLAIGNLEDQAFLEQSFAGADAVYLMFPPQYAALELDAYRELATKYAAAVKSNNIQYIVTLSSIGAHLPEGCGPVTGLYLAEQELNKLEHVHILHLRPGYFYLNLLGNLSMVRNMNILGNNSGDGNNPIVLSHPLDIAAAAAKALTELHFTGHSSKYLVSDERKQAELASVLGAAIGKPALPWIGFSDEQAYEGLTGAGLPETMAKKYVEMGAAMRTGKMFEDYAQHRPEERGNIKLEDFAKDFAAAYHAG